MTSLTTASLAEIREVAARICRDYLTGEWKTIAAEDLIVKRITGGLSNLLYYISLPADVSNSSSNNSNNNSPLKNAERATQAQKQRTFSDKARTNKGSTSMKQNLTPSLEIDNTRKRQRLTSSDDVSFTSSSGGSVGGLFQNVQEVEPREVLLRIYGQTHGENALEAMITESVVFALLSERGFGPKLHGIFPGGRIEQYLPARALKTAELSDHKISIKIAEKMGEIHSLNIPMSKEPDWLWNTTERWLKSTTNILKDHQSKDPGIEEILAFDYMEERKWLRSVIESINCPVLFCHNDFQEGNILLREAEQKTSISTQAAQDSSSRESINSNANDSSSIEDNDNDNTRDSFFGNTPEDCDPDLIIIDFEYCAYNYRGFDLANHFLEWTMDYSYPEFPFYSFTKSQYPTVQQRQNFIAAYLKKLNEAEDAYVPSEREIAAVEEEVQIFSMSSHLFWSLWSVVNLNSSIEFGYVEYAVDRIREYQRLKQEYQQTH